MPVKIERDGFIIHLDRGVQLLANGAELPITESRVTEAGHSFPDDVVADYVLEAAKAARPGDGSPVSYVTQEELDEVGTPAESGAEPAPAQESDEVAALREQLAEAQSQRDAALAQAETEREDAERRLDELAKSIDAGTAPETEPFHPANHNQEEVLDHLKDADADEVARVKALEEDGQKRQKIMAFEPKEG